MVPLLIKNKIIFGFSIAFSFLAESGIFWMPNRSLIPDVSEKQYCCYKSIQGFKKKKCFGGLLKRKANEMCPRWTSGGPQAESCLSRISEIPPSAFSAVAKRKQPAVRAARLQGQNTFSWVCTQPVVEPPSCDCLIHLGRKGPDNNALRQCLKIFSLAEVVLSPAVQIPGLFKC